MELQHSSYFRVVWSVRFTFVSWQSELRQGEIMAKKQPSKKHVGRRSHVEILAARGEKPLAGQARIAARKQRRLDRLRKIGVVLPGRTGHNVTYAQLNAAEESLRQALERMDQVENS